MEQIDVKVEPDGTVQIAPLRLPMSPALSDAFREEMVRAMQAGGVRSFVPDAGQSWEDVRKQLDEEFFGPFMAAAHQAYPVEIARSRIADIGVEIVTPAQGVAARNQGRVLVHAHCGAYSHGAHFIPDAIGLASVMGVRVVSLNYRMIPEVSLDDSIEDVCRVFRAVQAEHNPEAVGLVGSSAGASLAAMSTTVMLERGWGAPAAVAVLGGSGGFFIGDSDYLAPPATAYLMKELNLDKEVDALIGARDSRDPTAVPARFPERVAQFPPSFLLASTRDSELSGVLVLHRQLVRARRDVTLHVREGLPHAFHCAAWLPEARETFEDVARFFDAHLRASAG